MTIVVEDGTGLAGANALVAVATVTAYAAAVGNTAWATATTSAQEAAIVRATNYLRDETVWAWRGDKKTYAQRMPWPRTGAQEHRGPAVPDDVVPWRVADACCEAALVELASPGSLQPQIARGGRVVSETVGPISTTYAADAPARATVTKVAGILAPLLRRSDNLELAPVWVDAGPTQSYFGMDADPPADRLA